MALEVVGAGFGRTGTRSLKEALQMLGFNPCHHMMEVFTHREQVPLWDRAAQGDMKNWDEIFANYRASCDWPSCAFYKELAAFYPDSKVILTERDPKAWYKSVSSTIMASMKKPVPGQEGPPGIFIPLLIGENTFHNDFSEASMIAVYERHNAEVRKIIPPDRLLVYEPGQGWEPLCRFLGVDVPSVAYPFMNTTEEFLERRAEMLKQAKG